MVEQWDATNDCGRRLPRLLCLLLLFGPFRPAACEGPPTVAWKTASPESQGLDSEVLAEALDYVRMQGIPLHSFLIVRNGVMVLDAYIWPYQGREVHDVASVRRALPPQRSVSRSKEALSAECMREYSRSGARRHPIRILEKVP